MPRPRSKHFVRVRTVLRRPTAAPRALRRPAAYTRRAASRETNRQHVKKSLPLVLRPTKAGAPVRPERREAAGPTPPEVSRWSEARCRVYLEERLCCSVSRRTCWRCGEAYSNPRRQLQKGVKRNPTLRCSSRDCDGRLHNSRYTVTPGYKSLRRNKASTLTARQALQLLICFTDRIPLDAACSMADVETSRRSLYEQEPGLHTRCQDS